MDVSVVAALALLVTSVLTYLLIVYFKARPQVENLPPSFVLPPPSPPPSPPTPINPVDPKASVKIEVVASPLSWRDQSPSGDLIRTIATMEKFYHMGVRLTFPNEESMRFIVENPENVWIWGADDKMAQAYAWPADWKDYEKLSFELYADDFYHAPCPRVVDNIIQPGLASTKLMKPVDNWQLQLSIGEVSDLNVLKTLRIAVLSYASQNLQGSARKHGELLYSIYSSYNLRSGGASAYSSTCNTLVADILQYLNIPKPPIFAALRDAWDIIDDGLQPLGDFKETGWTDPDAVQYFKDLQEEVNDILNSDIHVWDLAHAEKVKDCMMKILNPTYMISYTTDARTDMVLFKVTKPQEPSTPISIRN